MKNSKKFAAIVLTAFLSVFTISCSDNDNDGSEAGTSRIRVSMTDAPGDYDEVNVEVVGLKYKTTTDTGEEGWVEIPGATVGVYNLLDLTGGVTVMLTDAEIPSGHLGQI